ncbi:TPA: hypothetical protein QCY66_005517 [Bacillus cereus]|nr:hypothetical protein [Bacillus cereus]
MLNQRLTEERKKILEAEYKGFNDLADRFLATTKSIASYEKNESIEIEEARATSRELFVALDILMTQRLPQFEIKGYEGVSLPLFAEICTLHLTLLKDGVLMGARWGLTNDDVKYYRNEFYRLTSNYDTRAVAMYSAGFHNILKNGSLKDLMVYKNTMNQYAMDLVYLWSLMRYEGITPSFSKSLWHFEGGVTRVNGSEWNQQYKLMNGVVNRSLANATFRTLNISSHHSLAGVWPKYTSYENGTGWMGSSVGQRNYIYQTPHSDPPKDAVIIPGGVFFSWIIKIGNTEVIPPVPVEAKPITYEGYYIRTISAIPQRSFPSNLNFSLGSKLELDLSPERPDYPGNVILGFAPDNTKKFFMTGAHKLPAKGSYTIPALQHSGLDNASSAFLVENLGQGTDGGISLSGASNSNVIEYGISMKDMDYNKKYVLFIRIYGSGSINAKLSTGRFSQPEFSKTIGDFSNSQLSVWKDYVSPGFTFKLDNNFLVDPLKIILTKKSDSSMMISQIMIIPEADYKIIIP